MSTVTVEIMEVKRDEQDRVLLICNAYTGEPREYKKEEDLPPSSIWKMEGGGFQYKKDGSNDPLSLFMVVMHIAGVVGANIDPDIDKMQLVASIVGGGGHLARGVPRGELLSSLKANEFRNVLEEHLEVLEKRPLPTEDIQAFCEADVEVLLSHLTMEGGVSNMLILQMVLEDVKWAQRNAYYTGYLVGAGLWNKEIAPTGEGHVGELSPEWKEMLGN